MGGTHEPQHSIESAIDALPGRFLAIEHFGSTAIPGMDGKPIIDILAGVDSMAAADELFDPLLRTCAEARPAYQRAFEDQLAVFKSTSIAAPGCIP
jgi:GrpB-like predicted nucleotidyltransferase (UPF0157 family)